jgi:serine/threonine protein kinase
MPAVTVRCPRCGQPHSVDGSLIGRKGRCKNCGAAFAIAATTERGGSGTQSPSGLLRSWSAGNALPERLGRFLVKERLGAGACGCVYRAVDPTLDRDVALKVPHPELQRDEEAIERFLREARAAAKLHHPHIVTVYEAGTDGDISYIASAFIPGRSLADAIDDGPFEPRRAARIIASLADALHAAHQQGIVHRDVKPANVLLDSADRPHLTDFGLARLAASSIKLTQVGSILGTPAYLAPEQARGMSDRADPACDQYSLGVTFYELLCGQVPFAGPLEVVIFNTIHTPPPPLREEHPEIPAALETICLKALSKKSEDRYPNCREMAKDLGRWLAGRPTSQVASTMHSQSDAAAVETAAGVSAPGSTVHSSSSRLPTLAIKLAPTDPGRPAGPGRSAIVGRRLRWGGLTAAAGVLVAVAAVLAYIVTNREKPKPKVDFATETSEISRPRPAPFLTNSAADADHRSAERPKPLSTDSKEAVSQPSRSKRTSDLSGVTPAPVVADAPRISRLGDQVDRAIRDGARFLTGLQRPDGSWVDFRNEASTKTGMTSLITLTLLAVGDKPDSPAVSKALNYLRGFDPEQLRNTYTIALQTMVFAEAEPESDKPRIAANARWLERAQIKEGDPVSWSGSWTYSDSKHALPGDNSNTHYALLGLHAASEVGVRVRPEVWTAARSYWLRGQKPNGSWAYTPASNDATASMTCAGTAGLIITRYWSSPTKGKEFLRGASIQDCGASGIDKGLQAGIDWIGSHFQVAANYGDGQMWRFFYLCGLERLGVLAGVRLYGNRDWYRLGAEQLVREPHPGGYWQGVQLESDKMLATSFAVTFLAKGRTPVLINKLRYVRSNHAANPASVSRDWNNDSDDVHNLVNVVARDWKSPLTWQVVDFPTATVSDLLRAPILYFNGHFAPEFTAQETEALRSYVEGGGVLFAEACCGSPAFDKGFRAIAKSMFPEVEHQLRPLTEAHPVWTCRYRLDPSVHSLWGIDRGGRTSVIYSPSDLSCYWNQAHRDAANPAVIGATKVGQNVVDYVTGRKPPRDKLAVQ